MHFSRDYTRVRRAAPRTKGEEPPELGQVSELIRNTLTKEYNIYPPNLSTSIQPDQTILITAVNNQTGLNVQVSLKNLAGNFIHPNGNLSGIVPPPQAAPEPPGVYPSSTVGS